MAVKMAVLMVFLLADGKATNWVVGKARQWVAKMDSKTAVG